MNQELLDLTESAKFLNVKESWMRTAIFKKKINFVKIGRLIRFRKVDLEKYIQKNLKEETKENFN